MSGVVRLTAWGLFLLFMGPVLMFPVLVLLAILVLFGLIAGAGWLAVMAADRLGERGVGRHAKSEDR